MMLQWARRMGRDVRIVIKSQERVCGYKCGSRREVNVFR